MRACLARLVSSHRERLLHPSKPGERESKHLPMANRRLADILTPENDQLRLEPVIERGRPAALGDLADASRCRPVDAVVVLSRAQ